jgi:hypothetical protein
MTKILLTLTIVSLLASCSNNKNSILERNKYTIVDTTHICRNGFDMVLTYEVIILNHYDSMYHAGEIRPDGKLIMYNPKPIKLK